RKPDVRPASLEEDLRRRDFTINALLMDLDGNIEDPLGGRSDLDAKVLRTPADPLRTFADDPLRMLRAIRFAAELGFSRDPRLLRAAARSHDGGKPQTAKGDGTFRGREEVGAEIAKRALERLRFAQKEIDAVVGLIRLHLRPVFCKSEWSDGAVRRLARDAGP